MSDPKTRSFEIDRASETLYSEELRKALKTIQKPEAISTQQTRIGRQALPFDICAARDMIKQNGYHSRCIRVKRNCTVGLGHADISADGKSSTPHDRTWKALSPLCGTHGWQDLLNGGGDDFWSTAQCYLEVMRDKKDNIIGLHRAPSPSIRVFIEDASYHKHYRCTSVGEGVGEVIFAEFGEREALLGRLDGSKNVSGLGKEIRKAFVKDPTRIHELIPIRQSTNMSRWYGYPDWLAATPSIELSQASQQHHADFFRNRGVPEILIVLKGPIEGPDYEKVKETLRGTIGRGNQHKSAVVQLQDPEAELLVEKLGLEGKADGSILESVSTTLGMEIVGIHGVPPLLAGILISGKLGASNEFPNALMSFQTTVLQEAQETFSQRLGATLGNPALNGGLGLTEKDFQFRRVTDVIDLATAATVGAMRQTVPEAKAQGRDLAGGVLKENRGD